MSVEYLQIKLTLYLPNFAINGRLAEDCLESFPEPWNCARQAVYSLEASMSTCTL